MRREKEPERCIETRGKNQGDASRLEGGPRETHGHQRRNQGDAWTPEKEPGRCIETRGKNQGDALRLEGEPRETH